MNIYQKINAIMRDVEYLAKDDKVETGNGRFYKAVSEEKVTGAIRASMVKHGVVIYPISQEHFREDKDTVPDKYGNVKTNRITTVNVTYRIQNIDETDDFITVVSSGTGVDTQDKGVGKAMTYAYKYMLLRTFAIPTGEDPDKIASDKYDEKLLKDAPAPVDNDGFNAIINNETLYCDKCGAEITQHGKYTAEQIAENTKKAYGKELCWACSVIEKGKRKAAENAG